MFGPHPTMLRAYFWSVLMDHSLQRGSGEPYVVPGIKYKESALALFYLFGPGIQCLLCSLTRAAFFGLSNPVDRHLHILQCFKDWQL